MNAYMMKVWDSEPLNQQKRLNQHSDCTRIASAVDSKFVQGLSELPR